MFPRPFEYHDPGDLPGVVDLLARYGEDAKLMAGGQSLLPMMKLRLASPRVIVDLWRVPGIESIEERGDWIAIGARATHYQLETSPVLRARCPVLAQAAGVIGDPQVRNLGTIGGSVAHADPAADYPPVLVALGARMRVRGPRGERTVPADAFFKSFFTTALEPAEVITAVEVPVPPPGTGAVYAKLSRRASDFGLVCVCAVVRPDGGARRVTVVLGGLGPVPFRAAAAEAVLGGDPPTAALLREAASRAVEGVDPLSDVHADAAYRLAVAPVYVRRALEAAYGQTRGGA